MTRRYSFSVELIGDGDTLEEAWACACEQAELEKIDTDDLDPVLIDVFCPECQENCLPDANDTPDEDRTHWNCQGCGKSWSATKTELVEAQ